MKHILRVLLPICSKYTYIYYQLVIEYYIKICIKITEVAVNYYMDC